MNTSVVIPTFNGTELLQKNLPTVFAALKDGDEVIIVDDASTDETIPWLSKNYSLEKTQSAVPDTDLLVGRYKDILLKILINRTNQRFASSCNRGVASAIHEFVILLNNDVCPRKDFREPLLAHFSDPLVFAVGCKEIATHEKNREYGRATAWFERGFYVHKRSEDQNGSDTAWASGGSSAFRTSMWKELGGFDRAYRPAYQEDIDLSYRARQRGWKILFEPSSVVYHNHESTNASVFGKQKMEVMSYKNAILFMWKNARGIQLVLHFLWLPYHLIVTTARSKGRFLHGFLLAAAQVCRQ